jgi:phosphoribosyl 1,2-cyclic phosphodiesterase
MSLFITSLNSGSNGNCYYIGNEDDAILVDAGISCRETERRLKRLGLLIEKIRAIFISHEHGDHIAGITVLAKKYQLPVYITPLTYKHGYLKILDKKLITSFKAFEPVRIGALTITAFPKFHDAADPHSFVVEHKQVTVGVFTDIGKVCKNVIQYFKQCHAIFLETNYDAEMLEKGSYPYHLKNRIRGGEGHLSNEEALALFMQHRPDFMSHVFLSHLSKNNNTPELAAALFKQHAGNTEIIVASRYTETPVYRITNTGHFPVVYKKTAIKKHQLQLSLF